MNPVTGGSGLKVGRPEEGDGEIDFALRFGAAQVEQVRRATGVESAFEDDIRCWIYAYLGVHLFPELADVIAVYPAQAVTGEDRAAPHDPEMVDA